jgi:hypothetical protein
MSKVELWDDGATVVFDCPGCGTTHALRVRTPTAGRPSWEFNGSVDKPTLQPSILATTSWKGVQQVCHSFVTDGRIQFLSDCTHELAGQTVDLQEVEPQ